MEACRKPQIWNYQRANRDVKLSDYLTNLSYRGEGSDSALTGVSFVSFELIQEALGLSDHIATLCEEIY